MTWEEFTTWAAFDSLEPIGGRRDDLLSAYWIATFVNMHRDRDKQPEPYPLTDFILVDRLKESVAPIPEPSDEDGATLDPALLALFMAHAVPEGSSH